MLRYKSEVDNIEKTTGYSCPPVGASEQSRMAWRWTFSPMTMKCFAPVAVRNPPRFLRATEPDEMCSCWSLSMHESEDASVSAFLCVEATFTKARKVLGTHIAKCHVNGLFG